MRPQGMSVRLELFVSDLARAIGFYRDVLGFTLLRHETGYAAYASLQNGAFILGLGPIAKLPETEGYFTQAILAETRGRGVEIVLELDDVEAALNHVQAMGHPVHEPLQRRPWGLTDFRIVDPDGYYLRITSRT